MHAQSRVLRAVPHANTHTVAHHRKGRNAPAVRAFSHLSRHARMHNPQESTDDEGLPSAAAAAAPVRARASGLRSPVSGRAYGPTTSRARSTRQQPAAAFKSAEPCVLRGHAVVTKSCSVQLNFSRRASTLNFITEATDRVKMLTHVGVCLH